MIYTTFVFLFLCLAVGLVNARVHKVEVLADQKGSAIHRHMQNLILTSLEEMRGIIKERLDQFLTMLEALEQTQLDQTLRSDTIDNLIVELGDNLKVFNASLGELEGTLNLFDLTVLQNDVIQLNTQSMVNTKALAEYYDKITILEEKTDGTS